MLIDAEISGNRNVFGKQAGKILTYKYRTIEIGRIWNVKTKVIPAITVATRIISKSFKKYLSNTLGNH
jgi:hypothetical protein